MDQRSCLKCSKRIDIGGWNGSSGFGHKPLPWAEVFFMTSGKEQPALRLSRLQYDTVHFPAVFKNDYLATGLQGQGRLKGIMVIHKDYVF